MCWRHRERERERERERAVVRVGHVNRKGGRAGGAGLDHAPGVARGRGSGSLRGYGLGFVVVGVDVGVGVGVGVGVAAWLYSLHSFVCLVGLLFTYLFPFPGLELLRWT